MHLHRHGQNARDGRVIIFPVIAQRVIARADDVVQVGTVGERPVIEITLIVDASIHGQHLRPGGHRRPVCPDVLSAVSIAHVHAPAVRIEHHLRDILVINRPDVHVHSHRQRSVHRRVGVRAVVAERIISGLEDVVKIGLIRHHAARADLHVVHESDLHNFGRVKNDRI